MQRRSLIKLSVASCLLSHSSSSLTDNIKYLKVSTMSGNDVLNRIVSTILIQAYHQLSVQLSVIDMPNDRALQFANDGDVDGVLFRALNINKKFPQLSDCSCPINVD